MGGKDKPVTLPTLKRQETRETAVTEPTLQIWTMTRKWELLWSISAAASAVSSAVSSAASIETASQTSLDSKISGLTAATQNNRSTLEKSSNGSEEEKEEEDENENDLAQNEISRS